MSAAPGTLLSGLANTEMDSSLARVADLVMDTATILTEMADYYLNMLTAENLAAGSLVVVENNAIRPMTPEELDRYRLYFGQTNDIAVKLTGGSPPATGLVQPWWQEFHKQPYPKVTAAPEEGGAT